MRALVQKAAQDEGKQEIESAILAGMKRAKDAEQKAVWERRNPPPELPPWMDSGLLGTQAGTVCYSADALKAKR